MRKPIVFLLILSLIAVQGCHGDDSGLKPTAAGTPNNRFSDYDSSPSGQAESQGYFLVAGAIIVVGLLLVPFVAVGHQIEVAFSPTPAESLGNMNDANNADDRRIGIINLVTLFDYAHKPPYTTKYKELAERDPDFTVRAMAIRALNISRDASATGIFIAALDDENELIRLEGAKALANVPDPAAIPVLEHLLDGRRESALDRARLPDESQDVRIAAADALRRYPKLDVARNLVGYLNEQDFGIAWQSHRSLGILTGRDLQYDEGAWLAYLTGPSRPFK